MDKRYFSEKLVKWYKVNHRNLPWRNTRDPYYIWLSEVILQQTRVNQGLPYYEKFVSRFPTVEKLANAPEQEVLRLWQGLGYYSRARNLHKCAKVVANEHNGLFPSTFEALRQLPGIGDYTAAAIASIAYGQDVAVVDGNVFRVLARIFGIDTPINSNQAKKEFAWLANDVLDKRKPDIHNQAMMEFGALFCTPKTPNCIECIFHESCKAFEEGRQLELPVKTKKADVRKRYFYYLVFKKGNSLAMNARNQKDIWLGLFDFPLLERPRRLSTENLLADPDIRSLVKKTTIDVSDEYKHVLTHQVIHARFITIHASTTTKISQSAKFYNKAQIAELPKPVLISRFLNDEGFL